MQGQYAILGMSVLVLVAATMWPRIIPVVYILGSIFLPIQAVSMIAGGDGTLETSGIIKNHPITYVLIPAIIIYCLVQRKRVARAIHNISGLRLILIMMCVFCAGAILETVVLRGVKGLPTAFENYLGPFLLFLFLVVYCLDDENSYISLLRIFVNCVLVAAIYGIVEYILKLNIT